MFVWTTPYPSFPIRVKTTERPAERDTPAPSQPQAAPPRPEPGDAGS
jgi:hypothetical protein